MKTAPMVGTSWQPSHKPLHSKRSRHPSHCRNSGKREGNGVPGRWAATLWNGRELLLYVHHVTLCYNPQAHGIPTHAHMCRHRWPPGERKCSLLLTPLNCIQMDHVMKLSLICNLFAFVLVLLLWSPTHFQWKTPSLCGLWREQRYGKE